METDKTSSLSLARKSKLSLYDYSLWGVLLVIIAIFTISQPFFIRPNNLINILLQVSVTGIMAVGMTFVIITGGIDLSVGSIIALSGIVAAFVAKSSSTGVFLPVICGALAGAAIGFFFNGIIVTYGKIAAFIVTLASMSGVRGLALILSNAAPVYGLNDKFLHLGFATIFGIPYVVIIFVITFVLAYLFQRFSPLARYIYAHGDNVEAARLTGLPIRKTLLFVYTFSGLCSGLAGSILASRVGSGEPTTGMTYELYAISAVIIGGTSINGGSGGIAKTFIGILILGVIDNGLNLLMVPSYYQYVVRGLIIVIAVLVDQLRNRRGYSFN